MGFLDHSTNNIIVDAVLTDRGRQALANNAFSITKFSLSDDEVDYTIIQKFGRTVGKEKIIKNTPIFEAQTGSELAQKYRMLTLSDASVIYLPTVELTGEITGNTVTLKATIGESTGESKAITLSQKSQGVSDPGEKFPPDNNFYVEVPNRFLNLEGLSDSVTAGENLINKTTQNAVYTVPSTTLDTGLKSLQVTLSTKSLDDTMFNTFGTTAAKDRIDCVVGITGQSTGIRTTINVVITKP